MIFIADRRGDLDIGLPVVLCKESKDLFKNNMATLHLIFGPSLAVAQSQNPQRSAATPAVLR
jgi:hypothetical protein